MKPNIQIKAPKFTPPDAIRLIHWLHEHYPVNCVPNFRWSMEGRVSTGRTGGCQLSTINPNSHAILLRVKLGTKKAPRNLVSVLKTIAHEHGHSRQHDNPTSICEELDADLFALDTLKVYLGRDVASEVSLYPQTKEYLATQTTPK